MIAVYRGVDTGGGNDKKYWARVAFCPPN